MYIETKEFWSPAPSSPTSKGIAGDMAYSSSYLYICVAANTWKRLTLSSF